MNWKFTPIIFAAFLAVGSSFACVSDNDSHHEDASVWTDPVTGLMWEVTPSSGFVNWDEARDHCDTLASDGHNDWRLPTISELRSLVRGCDRTDFDGPCPVSEECAERACQTGDCFACNFGGGPNDGCFAPPELEDACDYFWSSTLVPDGDARAWAIGFSSAFIYKPRTHFAFHARCVR
ncbi:MAG: DUF1566 domain-containing protein [Deltaproteobacteria bacterium]|nr:DUF1566 domain-containing protein [Deltaproteobacteria bacterium]